MHHLVLTQYIFFFSQQFNFILQNFYTNWAINMIFVIFAIELSGYPTIKGINLLLNNIRKYNLKNFNFTQVLFSIKQISK